MIALDLGPERWAELDRILDGALDLPEHERAGFLAERIVLLKSGRVAQIGTLRQLVEKPSESFVSDFINAQRSPLESLKLPLTAQTADEIAAGATSRSVDSGEGLS